jgi:hypothetical protein
MQAVRIVPDLQGNSLSFRERVGALACAESTSFLKGRTHNGYIEKKCPIRV